MDVNQSDEINNLSFNFNSNEKVKTKVCFYSMDENILI